MSSKTKPKTDIVTIPFVCAAASDPGRHRENNEDLFIFDPARGFFSVVDGMGGHEQGEVAAKLAAETTQTSVRRIEGPAEIRLRDSMILANNAVFETAQTNSVEMGCVLTCLLIEKDKIAVGHVGDTRLYKIRHGSIAKLTTDHSLVGKIEESGSLSEQRLMQHPRRNEVTRCLGMEKRSLDDQDFVDVFTGTFEDDAALLLCSDGLSDLITSAKILETVEDNAESTTETVRELIAKANEAGGKDNITVVIIAGSNFASETSTRRGNAPHSKKKLFSRSFLYGWILFLLGILFGGVAAYFILKYFAAAGI
jgi:serine/threonine protein phosphatase PrpC